MAKQPYEHAHTPQGQGAGLSLESMSAIFAHDISTPLSTAKMNADLLVEYLGLIQSALDSSAADKIPSHIQDAIARAPTILQQNLNQIQEAVKDYKDYLNCLGDQPVPAAAPTPPAVTLTGKSLAILLVDDEEIHHDIADAVLGKSHVLTHVRSGPSAIEQCKNQAFDVVLMDMQMPELSGQETTEQLRRIFTTPTAIIGLTNMPIQSQKQELLKIGFNGFLEKPLKRDSFDAVIEQLTEQE